MVLLFKLCEFLTLNIGTLQINNKIWTEFQCEKFPKRTSLLF